MACSLEENEQFSFLLETSANCWKVILWPRCLTNGSTNITTEFWIIKKTIWFFLVLHMLNILPNVVWFQTHTHSLDQIGSLPFQSLRPKGCNILQKQFKKSMMSQVSVASSSWWKSVVPSWVAENGIVLRIWKLNLNNANSLSLNPDTIF